MDPIAYLLIPLAVYFVFYIARKEKNRAQNMTSGYPVIMKLPAVYLWVGGICSVIFTGFTIMSHIYSNETSSWWTDLIFLSFAFLGFFIIYMQKTWEMKIYEDHIKYKNAIGRKYEIRFSDIKLIKKDKNGLVLKTDNDKFQIDQFATGIDTLLKIAENFNIPVQ